MATNAPPESAALGVSALEGPPSTGWVVHEVLSTSQGAAALWAWCKVGVSEPGYSEVHFTHADGMTPADHNPGWLELGSVIVKVWC